MPMSDLGNLSRTRCPEAGVHTPHPSCDKLYCTTQQTQIWCWLGITGSMMVTQLESLFFYSSNATFQILFAMQREYSWPTVATPPSCLLCKNTAQWWKCKIHLSSKENKRKNRSKLHHHHPFFFFLFPSKAIVTKYNFKLLNSLIPFVKQCKMTESESKCNMSLEVSFITLQFGSRLHAIKSKIDISSISHN